MLATAGHWQQLWCFPVSLGFLRMGRCTCCSGKCNARGLDMTDMRGETVCGKRYSRTSPGYRVCLLSLCWNCSDNPGPRPHMVAYTAETHWARHHARGLQTLALEDILRHAVLWQALPSIYMIMYIYIIYTSISMIHLWLGRMNTHSAATLLLTRPRVST